MKLKHRICICGGGSLGHTLAVVLGSHDENDVRILTRRPAEWQRELKIFYRDDFVMYGNINRVSSLPKEIILDANIIILTVPAFAHKELLKKIKPFLSPGSWVGAFPGTGGFEWIANALLGQDNPVFGLQRTPYVCRVQDYGRSVNVMGVRGEVWLGARPAIMASEMASIIGSLLQVPTYSLPNYLSVTLTPSNAFFHSARLFSLFHKFRHGEMWKDNPLFYEDWDLFASEVYLRCDDELQQICAALPIDLSKVLSIREHYNAQSASDLTNVIRSIPSLKGILTPMQSVLGAWEPDFMHRFFQEDMLITLASIKLIADAASIATPQIDQLLRWAQRILGVPIFVKGQLNVDLFPEFPGKKKGIEKLVAFY